MLRNDGYISRDEAARAHSAVIELIAPASDLNDVSRGELATLVGILWQMQVVSRNGLEEIVADMTQ